MAAIRMNDFANEPATLIDEQLIACERVVRSGWWILGNEVSSFEREFADWIGATAAIGCANGLDAIEIGLRALGVGAGDEVITTPMTAFATVLGILRAGASPVLADIDSNTGMLDPESVRRCVTSRTKAIVLVHLYGQGGPIEELLAIAQEFGLKIIEDCAQSHGAKVNGRSVGTLSDVGTWSFYPTKNLGAIGDAGALTTSDAQLAETARSLRNYGQTVRYVHEKVGMNSRLDELQAAILRVRLRYLDEWTARRRAIAREYANGIRNPHVRVLPTPGDRSRHVHHLFVVLSARRDELQEHLKRHNIESLIHYPVPIHRQSPCLTLSRDPQGLARADQHAATCLSIPCHPGLDSHAVGSVVDAINRFGE